MPTEPPASTAEPTAAVREELEALESALWRRETRFDRTFMERVLAPDFFEFGRSGRYWSREAVLAAPDQPFDSQLPLENLQMRLLAPGVVLVTYVSRARFGPELEVARRSSIWTRGERGWVLLFHQGTPLPEDLA